MREYIMNRASLKRHCEAVCQKFKDVPTSGIYSEHRLVLDLLEQTEFIPARNFTNCKKKRIWITTYWGSGIEPVVSAFDNRDAAETCARHYKRQDYKVCIDECDIFHKCIEQAESEDKNDAAERFELVI